MPVFDIELEDKLKESISSMMEELAQKEQEEEEEPGNGSPEEEELPGSDYDELEADDELKDAFRDYFPAKPVRLLKNRLMLVVLIVAVIIIVGMACFVRISGQLENSYQYQYEKALQCAEENDYEEAISHLERALAIDDSQADASFLLAQYYDKSGMRSSAVSVLNGILTRKADYSGRSEVYDLLLSIYEEEERYEEMGELLAECDADDIVSKYNEYAALTPQFNKEGGVYDELISITITGNTEGFVYYTLDGSSPSENSPVYETPILLESGDYIIRAMFVNMYGVASEIATQSYYISVSVPESPIVSLDSGTYNEPALIEVYHNDNTKIYYTIDGSVPDKYSERYSHPIELPYGMSNFSFIAINDDGAGSEPVSRSYRLSVEANFDAELAVQVLKNNLYAAGKLLNTDGNVPGKLGINQYRVQTAANIGETLYYVVYEEYVDITGQSHDTGNIYAIDVNTADLYKAYKIDEGEYHLTDFDE